LKAHNAQMSLQISQYRNEMEELNRRYFDLFYYNMECSWFKNKLENVVTVLSEMLSVCKLKGKINGM